MCDLYCDNGDDILDYKYDTFTDLAILLPDEINKKFKYNSFAQDNIDLLKSDIQKIIKKYNETHYDNYDIILGKDLSIDIIPINYDGYNEINLATDNYLIKYGFIWSFKKNKMFFEPDQMTDKEKISFLIKFICSETDEHKKYFEEFWKEYYNEN